MQISCASVTDVLYKEELSADEFWLYYIFFSKSYFFYSIRDLFFRDKRRNHLAIRIGFNF